MCVLVSVCVQILSLLASYGSMPLDTLHGMLRVMEEPDQP